MVLEEEQEKRRGCREGEEDLGDERGQVEGYTLNFAPMLAYPRELVKDTLAL